MSVIGHFFNLTKPTIMLLVVVTGASALALEGSFLSEPGKFLLAILALYLTGGSANALNQCLERDIDSKMKRTCERRPLPTGKLSPTAAYTFSIIIGVAGTLIFALLFNLLSALLAVATIIFYSVFYTLWLKKSTDQNIVIGGAAGAMAPIITWAAATDGMALTPILLFLIVFLWTPPHFWALALFCKDDYKEAQLPMMPVTRGDKATINQINWYALAMVIASLTMVFAEAGVIYALVALTLGTIFLKKTIELRRENTLSRQRGLFGYSIVYLFALFLAIVIDGVV